MAGITFEISPTTCSGGGHFDITASTGTRSFTWQAHKNELLEAPTNEELKTFADILIRLLVARLNTGDHAELRDRIHNLAVTIEPRAAS